MEALKTLFPLETVIVPEKSLETFFVSETLSFELVPIIALLGNNQLLSSPELHLELLSKQCVITKGLLECFGYTAGPEREFISEIKRYARHESAKIKRNSRKRLSITNSITPNEFLHLLRLGAIQLKSRHRRIPHFLQKMKEKIVNSDPWNPKFSHIARYVMNGIHDRYWYEETYKDVTSLLPNEEPRLICDLLAATSVRSSIEANVTKFFPALQQYHANEKCLVKISFGKEKVEIESSFKGFLDATIIHLNQIRDGKFLCEAVDDSAARKIKNFSKAMMGVPGAIPVDIWLMRAFDTDIKYMYKGKLLSRSPTAKLYDAIQGYLSFVAHEVGFEPRQISASVWAGIRGQTSTSSTTRFAPLMKRYLDSLNKPAVADLFTHVA